VLDAHTLEFEDGTVADLNGAITAPDLEQMGSIGGVPYPCGKEAAEFLRILIGDQEVICYYPNKRKEGKLDGRHCFIGEKRLIAELVRNGWAISHHTEMDGWEAMAKAVPCGLWRGKFALAPKQ
jgi:endonuclease YncB( thermonuclease family)